MHSPPDAQASILGSITWLTTTDRCTGRGGGIPSRSDQRCQDREIGDREIPREIRRDGREKVLLEVRCGSSGGTGLAIELDTVHGLGSKNLRQQKELYKWGGREGSMIDIQRYAGTQANVNSYLLSGADSVIVVDLLRNSLEAEKLADHVEASGKILETIFVTHGHPDHYLGLGVFHRRFPNVPVRVASREIRDDIIGFSGWMESVGWLDAEPTMKVKSIKNPKGFDYAGIVQVLETPFLKLSSEPTKIEVQCDIPAVNAGT
jgi:hypothetical protein